jgi:hypothetical protein
MLRREPTILVLGGTLPYSELAISDGCSFRLKRSVW